jgi:hypothetical protein
MNARVPARGHRSRCNPQRFAQVVSGRRFGSCSGRGFDHDARAENSTEVNHGQEEEHEQRENEDELDQRLAGFGAASRKSVLV